MCDASLIHNAWGICIVEQHAAESNVDKEKWFNQERCHTIIANFQPYSLCVLFYQSNHHQPQATCNL